MTREAALAELRRLAHGLDLGEESRLLERASSHDECETLRSALVELGASVLLVVTSAEVEAIRGAVELVAWVASGEAPDLGTVEAACARAVVAAESPLSPGRVQTDEPCRKARHGVLGESRLSARGVKPCAVNLGELSVDHHAGGSE
jgi:hypothetical protein